ncbi:MAG: hypothetical protein KOO63_07835 [Bacteroidales bacterium]|nr:hypothetical protein [Candidatus Latescibacterota bacterium]
MVAIAEWAPITWYLLVAVGLAVVGLIANSAHYYKVHNGTDVDEFVLLSMILILLLAFLWPISVGFGLLFGIMWSIHKITVQILRKDDTG